jgi:hypothetical protein
VVAGVPVQERLTKNKAQTRIIANRSLIPCFTLSPFFLKNLQENYGI